MNISRFHKVSMIDFPGLISSVVFTQGCNMSCKYCHNPDLIEDSGVSSMGWSEIENHLKKRRGLIDAVIFSGGEPTLQADLNEKISKVRQLGFKVGIHTNGYDIDKISEADYILLSHFTDEKIGNAGNKTARLDISRVISENNQWRNVIKRVK